MPKLGTVYLVGAGPGDPGLLTLRGLECLQKADLILYDGLVNPLLLRHTSALAERTCRTLTPEGRVLRQDEINARLISAAREGKTVVRLKGGDPFIFGRGSEEAAALVAARVPFEVVPGVTAATAAGEYAGISLTHREQASAVTFVTGHEDPEKEATSIDYKVLAAFSGTLVFYMGLHRLESIVGSLIAAGKPRDTPACVISRATMPLQKTVAARLEDLPPAVQAARLSAPSVIVVGECVRQREKIAWFEKRPLFGMRVGITRPSVAAGETIARALQLGAQPVLMPTIEVLPLDDLSEVDGVLKRLDEYDWLVFSSSNGVTALLGRLWSSGGDMRCLSSLRLAAIGPTTDEALGQFHLRADVVPPTFRAEVLAETLKPLVRGKRVLWARASRARDVLPQQLESVGAAIDELVVYRHVDVPALPDEAHAAIERGGVDWIGLSSPSIARSLACLLSPAATAQLGRAVSLASISPVTSAAAREVGLPIAAEATTHTWDGIFEAIMAAEERCG